MLSKLLCLGMCLFTPKPKVGFHVDNSILYLAEHLTLQDHDVVTFSKRVRWSYPLIRGFFG